MPDYAGLFLISHWITRFCRKLCGEPQTGAAKVLSPLRKPRTPRGDELALTEAIIRLANQFGRYNYRRITELMRRDGWHVNEKRVYRIWRREGLKVPQKQPKRGRLWLDDGSCARLRPAQKGYVCSYDFV
jgi:putative transposase